jgi:hypothetical protein
MAAPVVSSCDVSALGYGVKENLDSGSGLSRRGLECTRRRQVHGLQGNERAACRHGGPHYGVVEGCASPGRRGSDLFRRVGGYGVGQAFANEEGNACVATGWRVELLGCMNSNGVDELLGLSAADGLASNRGIAT